MTTPVSDMDRYMIKMMNEYNQMINKVNKNVIYSWNIVKHTICLTSNSSKQSSTLVSKNWKSMIDFMNGIAYHVYGDALDWCVIFEDHRPKFVHTIVGHPDAN